MSAEFQYEEMKIDLERDVGNDCTAMWVYLMPLNCTFKNGDNGKKKIINFMLYVFYHNKKKSLVRKILCCLQNYVFF